MTTRHRRALLLAALGFLELQWRYKPAAVGALERWLHTVARPHGVGAVAVAVGAAGGMAGAERAAGGVNSSLRSRATGQ